MMRNVTFTLVYITFVYTYTSKSPRPGTPATNEIPSGEHHEGNKNLAYWQSTCVLAHVFAFEGMSCCMTSMSVSGGERM